MSLQPPAPDPASKASKRRRIYDSLVEQIGSRSLKEGAKLPSATDLAAAWGISYATIHGALADLTRDGWLIRYPKHGTFVASRQPQPAPPSAAPATALLFLPHRDDIVTSGHGPLVFETLQGLSEGAQEVGWNLQIRSIPTNLDAALIAEQIETARHANALLFIGDQYHPLQAKANATGRLTLSLYSEQEEGFIVTYDRAASIALGVRYLLRKGCTNIAFFGNDSPQKRLHFQTALAGHQEHAPYYAYPNVAGIEALLQDYLRTPLRHDGLFFTHYPTAIRFVQALRTLNLAGEVQVATIGMEEAILPEQRLPYVRIPYLEVGKEALRLLAGGTLLRTDTRDQTFCLPPAFCDLPNVPALV